MTLNGRNVTLAEIKNTKPTKKLNEDRFILSAAKCRAMILVSRNIKYMRIFAGFLGEWCQFSTFIVEIYCVR